MLDEVHLSDMPASAIEVRGRLWCNDWQFVVV